MCRMSRSGQIVQWRGVSNATVQIFKTRYVPSPPSSFRPLILFLTINISPHLFNKAIAKWTLRLEATLQDDARVRGSYLGAISN